MREIVRTFPIPDDVTFDPVDPAAFASAPTGPDVTISFGDFRLLDPSGREVETLPSLLSDLSLQLMGERLAMPTQVRVSFDPPAVLRMDRFGLSVPIKALETLFVLSTRTEQRVVRKPVVRHRYDYRNIGSGEVHSFKLD